MTVLLDISYIGTAYAGWQIQPNAPTVQAAMCDAVERLLGVRCPVTGCSRTDSGVHAHSFCCTVSELPEGFSIPTDRIPLALSSVLPEDISVRRATVVPDDFHPRYGCLGKEYVYRIYNSRVRDPFSVGRALHIPHPLDAERMNEAAVHLVGEHDFAAFVAAGSKVAAEGDTVRRIYGASVTRDGDDIRFCVSGNGFLYNMVRIMTGTLIAVSDGRRGPEDIDGIIASRDRQRAGITVPACGLYLERVFYPEWVWQDK